MPDRARRRQRAVALAYSLIYRAQRLGHVVGAPAAIVTMGSFLTRLCAFGTPRLARPQKLCEVLSFGADRMCVSTDSPHFDSKFPNVSSNSEAHFAKAAATAAKQAQAREPVPVWAHISSVSLGGLRAIVQRRDAGGWQGLGIALLLRKASHHPER